MAPHGYGRVSPDGCGRGRCGHVLVDCPRAEAVPVPRVQPRSAPLGPVLGPADPNADVAALGYEEARDELVAVVARLEAGAATLEESLALWERGEALATRCQEWLDGARERLSAVRDGGQRSQDSTTDTTDGETR